MTTINYLIARIAQAADPAANSSLVNPTTLVAMIAAAAAIGGAVLTYRSSQRANSVNDRKVGLEEHRDSIARLQAVINEQDRFTERLQAQVDRLYTQLDHLQNQLSQELESGSGLRRQVMILEDQVRTLKRMLAEKLPRRAAADLADGVMDGYSQEAID